MTLPVEKVRLAAPRLCPRLMTLARRSPTHTHMRTHEWTDGYAPAPVLEPSKCSGKQVHICGHEHTPSSSAQLLNGLWEEGFPALIVQVLLTFDLLSCFSKLRGGCWEYKTNMRTSLISAERMNGSTLFRKCVHTVNCAGRWLVFSLRTQSRWSSMT